jgi:hypothetical protein
MTLGSGILYLNIRASFVIDFELSFSPSSLLFVARRCRAVTICVPGSHATGRISE